MRRLWLRLTRPWYVILHHLPEGDPVAEMVTESASLAVSLALAKERATCHVGSRRTVVAVRLLRFLPLSDEVAVARAVAGRGDVVLDLSC